MPVAASRRVDEIKQLHDEIETSLRKSLTSVIRVGKLLEEQKQEIGYGNWHTWVAQQNFPFSQATADNYRRVYRKLQEDPTLLNVSKLSAVYARVYGEPQPRPKKKKKGKADNPPRQLTLELTKEEQKEIRMLVRKLLERIPTTRSTKDMIIHAIRHLYKDQIDENYSLDHGNIGPVGGGTRRKVPGRKPHFGVVRQ